MIKAINELATINIGKTLRTDQLRTEWEPGLKPYIRSHVDLGRIEPKPARWTKSKSAYISPERSLVLAIGHPNLMANHLTSDTAISSHIVEVKPKLSNVSAEFIRFALLYFAKLKKNEVSDDSSAANLIRELSLYRLNIPSLEEQDLQVATIRDFEASVIAQENAVEALRTRVAETFLKVLGKPEQGNSNFTQFVPLGSLATVSRGISFVSVPDGSDSDPDIRCLARLTGDPISPVQQFVYPSKRPGFRRDVLRPSDIVISRSLRKLLLAIIWPHGQAEARFTDRLMSIRVNPKLVNATYLLALIRSKYASEALTSTAHGLNMRLVSVASLESFSVPLPPMDLQVQFAEVYEQAVEMYKHEVSYLQQQQDKFDSNLTEIFGQYACDRDWF